jgi:hypothetical protein
MKIYDPDAARTKAIASMFDGIPESMSLNTEVGAMDVQQRMNMQTSC